MSEGMPRRLYDMQWLREECQNGVLALPQGSMVDDSFTVASTCLLAGVAGALAAAAVFATKALPLRFRILAAGFCGLEGLAQALTGVLMLLVHPSRGPYGLVNGEPPHDGMAFLYWLPQLLRLAGALMMCVLTNQVLLIIGGLFPGPTIVWLNGISALFVAFTAYAFCSGHRGPPLVNGVIAGIIAYGIMALAMRGKLMKCRALALILVGLLVRLLLEGRCGNNGYAYCFVDCPLPYWNGSQWGLFFNHTTTALLFEAAGLLLFSWSIYIDPDFTTEEQPAPKPVVEPKPKPVVEPKEPAEVDLLAEAPPVPAARSCAPRSCTAGCASQ